MIDLGQGLPTEETTDDHDLQGNFLP
jgi:hypothetical protein